MKTEKDSFVDPHPGVAVGNDAVTPQNEGYQLTEVTEVTDKTIIQPTAFPLSVFPDSFVSAVAPISRAFCVPPEICASAMSTVISGALGNTIRVYVTQSYTVSPFIWLVIIGKSGKGKTPLLSYLMSPVLDKQAMHYDIYTREMKVWNKQRARAEKGDRIELPEQPLLTHVAVEDVTIEALSDVFHCSGRGVIGHYDELAGLVSGLNQYRGKGNDLQHYLSLFGAGPWKIDRRSGTRFIKNTGLALIGGIQPHIVPAIFGDDIISNGFFPRFLTLNLSELPNRLDRQGIDPEVREYWIRLLDSCYSVPLNYDEKGFVKPYLLRFSEAAFDQWVEWHDTIAVKIPYLSSRLAPFVEKVKGYYSLKFAGVLHAVKCIDKGLPIERTLIDEEVASGAVKLADFFSGQAVRTLELYDLGRRLNEFQLRLITVLYGLREQVKNGHLPLSLIREKFNQGLPESLQHGPEAISSLARGLGLTTDKRTNNMSFLLWEPRKLNSLFSQTTVTTVTTVPSPERSIIPPETEVPNTDPDAKG